MRTKKGMKAAKREIRERSISLKNPPRINCGKAECLNQFSTRDIPSSASDGIR